jgi:hypothetical protein
MEIAPAATRQSVSLQLRANLLFGKGPPASGDPTSTLGNSIRFVATSASPDGYGAPRAGPLDQAD